MKEACQSHNPRNLLPSQARAGRQTGSGEFPLLGKLAQYPVIQGTSERPILVLLKSGPEISRVSMTWELVSDAQFLAPFPTYRVRICMFMRTPSGPGGSL